MEHTEQLTLEVPGTPEDVATARVFGATIARNLGLDEALVEDLKLAISEAATLALAGPEPRFRVVIRPGSRSMRVEIVSAGSGLRRLAATQGNGDSPHEGVELALAVLNGLFDDLRVELGPDGSTCVAFVVPSG